MADKPSSTARLEAFSDGVIAVIITIMVLELKVPHENGIDGFYGIIPVLAIYLLSFVFTGIYWINHQHLIERVEEADALVLYSNLGFLFCLSLVPFFTAYVIEKKIGSLAVALYAVCMCVIGLSFFLLRLAIHRSLRLSGHLERRDTEERVKHLICLILYVIAMPLAYVHAGLALLIIAAVAFVWIIPELALSKGE